MPTKRRLRQPTSARTTQKMASHLNNNTERSIDDNAIRDEFFFRATKTANDAQFLTDGVVLASSKMQRRSQRLLNKNNSENEAAAATATATDNDDVILPWVGFGTYKLGKDIAYKTVLTALECGYRCIDTAFIYGGETTERLVGKAIQTALEKNLLQNRQELFVVTKHWRKYHGYEKTLECLKLSLNRLQLEYIDLYLMHWPGPAWNTMNRRKDLIASQGPWYYATEDCNDPTQMAKLRSETWRAMEDALKEGKVRSIGVSNFTVEHLKALKRTATIWPPAVNQVEFHPLYPQTELLEYCRNEGIILQAYASLGGQDTGAKQWKTLSLEGAEIMMDAADTGAQQQQPEQTSKPQTGKKKPKQKKLRDSVVSLLSCRPVVSLARQLNVTPAQVLLRWALSQNCVVIPKASSKERMQENANVLSFCLSEEQISDITKNVQSALTKAIGDDLTEEDKLALGKVGETALGRLCWRNDPLRHLDFE